MPITVITNHGEYTAPTFAEAISREYGNRARAMRSGDLTNPHWGIIVEYESGSYRMLARIIRVEGESDSAAEG